MARHVLVGISGGIAAYKSLELIRLFVKNGYEVRVVATKHALEFVTPLTIETLSNNKLYVDMFATQFERTTEHISLAQWADICVLAPATANIIGKIANGIADDALSTVLLAFDKPVFFAPAMNTNMLQHAAVLKNIDFLIQNGYQQIEPQCGFLACNKEGMGRMAEPQVIFNIVDNFFNPQQNKKALVTAGGTQEPIDAVRYIGNSSSGLMGICIAEALANKGFKVDLIIGPTHLQTQHPNINRIDIKTADDMLKVARNSAKNADLIVMAAAVADYKPSQSFDKKLKKQQQDLQLTLSPTTDILKTLSATKSPNQIIVGFALETDNELENAKKKLHEKKLDFIVLNSLNEKGAGFATTTNKVYIIDKNDNVINLPLQSKQEIARKIVKHILNE